jgi:hypothetical protein
MFIPAFEEKEKQEQQKIVEEKRLELPDYSEQYEEYIKNKLKEKPKENVITIQLI